MAVLGVRLDPFPAFNFHVVLVETGVLGAVRTAIGAAAGGFSECSGLDGTLQVEEYPEGGENGYVHKFATRMTYSNITLRRGVGLSEELWNWHYQYVQGRGKRRDGVIILQTELRVPVKTWIFRGGLPVKWTGPTFNAAQSAAAIEALEIAHQGLELVSPGAALESATQAVF